MSVDTNVIGGMIAAVVGMTILELVYPDLGTIVTASILVAVYFIGVSVWIYSPLPNHNGGWGRPPARMQKWGWTDEPRHDDYEEPTTEEVMSAAVPGGWSFASRKSDSEEQ